MKILLTALLTGAVFSSCTNTWNKDDKQAFFQACVDDANTWAKDTAMAKTYCDCVVTKVMQKYPSVNDAVAQIETISKDPEIQACKTQLVK